MPDTKVQERGKIFSLLASKNPVVIGIDEAGTGALAGPVVAGVVVSATGWQHRLVRDSKQFARTNKSTAHERRIKVVETIIKPQVFYWGYAVLSAEAIDSIGIRNAWVKCLHALVSECLKYYPEATVVIDGNADPGLTLPNLILLPKADILVSAVSAASIIAKTERDKMMIELDGLYGMYQFKKHKGYGTAEHLKAIEQYGPCPIHRQSYKPVREATEAWQTRQQRLETPDLMP